MKYESIQRSRVTEGLTQIAFDLILGRQVQFLEEFRRYGDATCCPNLMERSTGIDRSIEVPMSAISVS